MIRQLFGAFQVMLKEDRTSFRTPLEKQVTFGLNINFHRYGLGVSLQSK